MLRPVAGARCWGPLLGPVAGAWGPGLGHGAYAWARGARDKRARKHGVRGRCLTGTMGDFAAGKLIDGAQHASAPPPGQVV